LLLTSPVRQVDDMDTDWLRWRHQKKFTARRDPDGFGRKQDGDGHSLVSVRE
jgi:hypothetical protein